MLSVAYQKEALQASAGCRTNLASVAARRRLTTLSASSLSESVRKFVEEKAAICKPENIQVCDGSEAENQQLVELMVQQGMLEKLPKYENW